MYGHVNNATYLTFVEHARVQLLEDIGLPLKELSKMGIYLVIAEVNISYLSPATLHDKLEVRTKYLKKTRLGGTFSQNIYRGSDLITEAEVRWVCVDDKGRPIPVPKLLAEF
jgi:YbgC/YbaW family acyl-CoA thioester hydrolase